MAPSPSGLRFCLPPTLWLAQAWSWLSTAAAMKRWQLRAPLGQLVGIYSAKLSLETDLFNII